MKNCLFILYVYAIARVTMMPPAEQKQAQDSATTSILFANDLPIELPAEVLQLLDRLETAAKAGTAMSSNIVAYLQQHYTPQDIAQLDQFAARIHTQIRQSIQGAFDRFEESLLAYQMLLLLQRQHVQRTPSQLQHITATTSLLQTLGQRVELLRQLLWRVRTEAQAHIRQQQMHIADNWQLWIKALSHNETAIGVTDFTAAQHFLNDYLQVYREDLDNCADQLVFRVQDYELRVWRHIEALETMLQQQRVQFELCLEKRNDSSEQLPCHHQDTTDLPITPHEFDELHTAAALWLNADYAEIDCFARVVHNFNGANEMLSERLRHELEATRRVQL